MANDKITTIKLNKDTKARLEHLREHKSESYDEIINKSLNILNIARRSPGLGARILRDMDRSKKMGKLVNNPDKIIIKRKSPQIQVDAQRLQSRRMI